MKCEACKVESDKVETLTLCDACFHRLNDKTMILFLENIALKLIIENLLKKDGKKGENDG